MTTKEKQRLFDDRDKVTNWRKFGPYLTERQWGTVREDYSPYGNAWEYVSHDAARSKAYRWGEEGIGGISDDQQILNFSVALWNEKDSILKERIYGLTGNEGNHAEDCKEHYYYLDSTPTHSYMKMLYKYPQAAFPYEQLVKENRRRGKLDPEYELVDTGVFDENKYFDVVIEYAKADATDILVKITVFNRGPQEAKLHVLPQIWYRNTWAWGEDPYKPEMYRDDDGSIKVGHSVLGDYYCFSEGKPDILFCENETNTQRLFNYPKEGTSKDGINDYLVNGVEAAINHNHKGTKAAIDHYLKIGAGKSKSIRLRLTSQFNAEPFKDFNDTFKTRQAEADEFYHEAQHAIMDEDNKNIQRQAFAGMLLEQAVLLL